MELRSELFEVRKGEGGLSIRCQQLRLVLWCERQSANVASGFYLLLTKGDGNAAKF